ncbi:MAG: hypothetical protein GC184_04120 [Rhizobiales bacterium]|nr:hypothetical protein [Hyphomicrobiales bacterium]
MSSYKEKNSGGFDDALARAEAAIAELKESYHAQLGLDIAELETAYGELSDPATSSAALKTLASLAHNIKGQGGSFGYDLATEIGGALSDFLRQRPAPAGRARRIIHLYIRMLRIVFERKLVEDGGSMGRSLRLKLKRLNNVL